MSNGGNGSLNKSFRATPGPASIWQTPTTFLRRPNIGGYFITHDQRILTSSGRLQEVLPPSLTVVTLVDFLAIFDDYAARDANDCRYP